MTTTTSTKSFKQTEWYKQECLEAIAKANIIFPTKERLLNNMIQMNVMKTDINTIDFLIKSDSSLKVFLSKFWSGTYDREFYSSDIGNYHLHRLISSEMSFDEFKDLFSFDQRNCIETHFQKPCTNLELSKLAKKLKSGELTLEFIFNKSKEDNWYNSVGKFVRSNWKE